MKINKFVTAIMLVFVLTILVSNNIFATDYRDPSKLTGNVDNVNGIVTISNRIIGALQVIGAAVAMTMILIIGIKYITGSAQEKAEYKKTMVPYLVGAVLIFAASNIAGWVYEWAHTIK